MDERVNPILEEMVQADKNTTKLSERRHLSQVPPILSPFISESVTFSDAAKRGAGLTHSQLLEGLKCESK
jgi:hypothetical protein